MCKIDYKIHFCTCKDDKNIKTFEENLSKKTFLLWSLNKYLGFYDSGLDGILMPPQSILTIDLKSDFILKELNRNENLFDFKYTPKEGDNLIIKELSTKREISYSKLKKRLKRGDFIRSMSFIFKENKWIEDYYDAFITKTEEFKKGTLVKKHTPHNNT